MAPADKYLYEGERILASFHAKGRGLAATETRVICTQPGLFYDVVYNGLSSVGCGSVYEPAWALASFVLTALAIAFAWMASLVPRSLPVGPFSIGLDRLTSLAGFPGIACGALAIVVAAAFLATARQGIVMRAAGGTFIFGYNKDDKERAIAFVKAVRAACNGNAPALCREPTSGI